MKGIEGAGCDMDGNSGAGGFEAGVAQTHFRWPQCRESTKRMKQMSRSRRSVGVKFRTFLLEIRNTRQKEKSEDRKAEKAKLQEKGSRFKENDVAGKAATVNSAKGKSNKQVNGGDDLQMAGIWAEMRVAGKAPQKAANSKGEVDAALNIETVRLRAELAA